MDDLPVPELASSSFLPSVSLADAFYLGPAFVLRFSLACTEAWPAAVSRRRKILVLEDLVLVANSEV